MIDFSRGFLSNYPEDVVRVINGKPITRQDILDNKRERQARELALKRRVWMPEAKPCFVWTFYNDTWIYGGWWLYVITLKYSWQISSHSYYVDKFILPIMKLFPCGYLPVIEDFEPWKAAFAERYHRGSRKRPTRQGMALARAVISSSGWLEGVIKG